MGGQLKIFGPLGTFLLILAQFAIVQGLFNCPPPAEISPGYCLNQPSHGYELDIGFTFYEPTPFPQKTLNNIIPSVRRANDLTGDLDWISVYGLYFRWADWNPMNLTYFDRSRIAELQIDRNGQLSQISDLPPGRNIGIQYLNFLDCPSVGDELITKFLSVLEPSTLETIQMGNGNLSSSFLESRPFEPFHFLENVYLAGNKIGRIRAGQLGSLVRLKKLYLNRNGIKEIEENALRIDDPEEGADLSGETLTLSFGANNLTATSIHHNHGLSSIKKRPIIWDLGDNQLTRVNRTVFEEFLYAHPSNKVQLYGNPIFCDDSMKWLKDARNELELKVQQANCVNDLGKNVFTTDLISSTA